MTGPKNRDFCPTRRHAPPAPLPARPPKGTTCESHARGTGKIFFYFSGDLFSSPEIFGMGAAGKRNFARASRARSSRFLWNAKNYLILVEIYFCQFFENAFSISARWEISGARFARAAEVLARALLRLIALECASRFENNFTLNLFLRWKVPKGA